MCSLNAEVMDDYYYKQMCVCVSLLINDKSAWEEELMFTKPTTAKYSIRNLTFIHRLLWHNHRLCPKFSFQNKFTLGSNMFAHSFDFISSQLMSCWTHVHTHTKMGSACSSLSTVHTDFRHFLGGFKIRCLCKLYKGEGLQGKVTDAAMFCVAE